MKSSKDIKDLNIINQWTSVRHYLATTRKTSLKTLIKVDHKLVYNEVQIGFRGLNYCVV